MEHYFNYFTEIEEHFQQRRGTLTLLSPLDWALMEIWKDAGVPLEAVIRGIDASFDKWERRPKRTRKVNGLAYCAQEVLSAAEQINEASTGTAGQKKEPPELDRQSVSEFLLNNAEQLESSHLPEPGHNIALESAAGLRDIAALFESTSPPATEDIERRLTVMEEKLIAALLASTPEAALLQVRTEADRDLALYRSRMNPPQIDQLHRQYVQKRLFEQYYLPRLSLFYMRSA